MAITKAQIFETILTRLRGSGADVIDLDEELRSVLYDVSTRDDFLTTTTTQATAAGTASYTAPTGFKQAFHLGIDGGHVLERITLDTYHLYDQDSTPVNAWDDTETYDAGDKVTYGGLTYNALLGTNLDKEPGVETTYWEEVTSNRGKPQFWAFWDGSFYFYPCPDGIYTINIYYSYFHPDDDTAIEYAENFRECIYQGVLSHLWRGQLQSVQGSPGRAAGHMALHEAEIQKRRDGLHKPTRHVRYHDI